MGGRYKWFLQLPIGYTFLPISFVFPFLFVCALFLPPPTVLWALMSSFFPLPPPPPPPFSLSHISFSSPSPSPPATGAAIDGYNSHQDGPKSMGFAKIRTACFGSHIIFETLSIPVPPKTKRRKGRRGEKKNQRIPLFSPPAAEAMR